MRALRLITGLIASVFLFAHANVAAAHEVFPSILNIAPVEGAPDELRLEYDVNLEAMLAGIDLRDLTDTNAAPNVADYDALRALSPEALLDRFRAGQGALSAKLHLLADGEEVPLVYQEAEVFDPGNPEIARQTRLIYSAPLPAGTTMLRTGWAPEYGTLVVRQNGVAEPFTGTVTGGAMTGPFHAAGGDARSGWAAFAEYIPIGFDHIVPKGLDHILFVLGVFLLAARWRPILWQVTAFTLAHTITLAAGALGWVVVPGSIVEPLIAASIVYIAVENILTNHLTPWRPVVVFLFGLLHGLGFASVLEEFGLPTDAFIPALLGFNVGVELGQITVIAIAFLTVGFWFRDKPWYRQVVVIPGSTAIALVGAWWFIERTVL
ncbi:HupE/UreJ family protein [Rhodalgimonas zhirmunskyi]|uniref:HupE/UreJ family protein n=1 Tax=Rhodalgimonas zhirmunskyi TaxID=2964767 RepID=A0AAJ1U3Z4_9RHOB|nr:HupE/UreJ family protein [Rhodoalgimonas zhirmunskyi]MDQ2092795.1 HupE/UreJ family protein [Rhodoalgimonas zhirmunskyi]